MYELTTEGEEVLLAYLEAHPESEIWDAVIAWLRPLCEAPLAQAGYELRPGTFFAYVPGTEVAVVYAVVDDPAPVVEILRVD